MAFKFSDKYLKNTVTAADLDAVSSEVAAAAKMLDENRVYTEITEKTGLSTATISRINRCLKYGSNGYADVLRKLDESGIKPPAICGDTTSEGENSNA